MDIPGIPLPFRANSCRPGLQGSHFSPRRAEARLSVLRTREIPADPCTPKRRPQGAEHWGARLGGRGGEAGEAGFSRPRTGEAAYGRPTSPQGQRGGLRAADHLRRRLRRRAFSWEIRSRSGHIEEAPQGAEHRGAAGTAARCPKGREAWAPRRGLKGPLRRPVEARRAREARLGRAEDARMVTNSGS